MDNFYLPICVISHVMSLDYSHFHLCLGFQKVTRRLSTGPALSFVLKKSEANKTAQLYH